MDTMDLAGPWAGMEASVPPPCPLESPPERSTRSQRLRFALPVQVCVANFGRFLCVVGTSAKALRIESESAACKLPARLPHEQARETTTGSFSWPQ